MVEISYGGLIKRTCVLVRVQKDINDDRDCESLFSEARSTVSDSLKTTWAQNPYGLSGAIVRQGLEFLTDRLEIMPPDHPVEFAQPLQIPVKTSDSKVLYYTVAQSGQGSFTNTNALKIAANEPDAPLSFISLVPLQFDDDLVLITAHFADHGISQRFFRLNVLPSGKGLKSIELHTFPTDDGYLRVTATLNYEQLKTPVQLPDLKRTTYRIDRGQIPDVLRIERDGRIRRVRAGNAAIVATFCGVTAGIEVNVREPVTKEPAS